MTTTSGTWELADVEEEETLGPIAQKIEKVMFGCADPKGWTVGVSETRHKPFRRCARGWAGWIDTGTAFGTGDTERWLDGFVDWYTNHLYTSLMTFNDRNSREQLIWMLQEALEEAVELGV